MAWSGQHRAFVVEEFIKNGGSVITTQRAFRLHFAIGRRDPIPTGPTIRNWVSNFRATSSALKTRPQGRIRTSTSAENVDRVRASIQQSPRRSVRKHAASLGLSFSSVRRILHRDLKFHPYKIQKYTVKNISRPKRIKTKLDMETKCREDPLVMKLDTPEFHNIFSNEVLDLKKIFDKYQYEIRIAGGAVRDLLLGQQAKDLDFATTATPQQMKEMFTTENVRMINLSGEKHGTITPRINDKENFEITTLRIDMVTDGRHAEVEFTKDWKLDANRRDLTINSMFLGFDGSVYDYFYGLDDLQKRRIAFVGDPDVRIKEDYLRIMRYFRFYGRIADSCDNHDEYTLNIIKNNADGLQNVSGERIWMELKNILQGNFAGDLLKTMLSVNIGQHIGIPNCNMEELNSLLKRSKHLNLHPMSYLAALLYNIDDVTVLHNRLKFSSYDRDMAYFLVENRNEKTGSRPLLPYEKLVLNTKIKQKDAVDYVKEVLTYKGDEKLLNEFNNWEIPKFPVNGKILKESGVPPGKMYGPIMIKLKDLWIENEYKHSTEDLVKIIPSVVEEFKRK